GRYKLGGARMAKMFEMDIIPVALKSGEFWPRNSFLKDPGTVSVIIGKPIAHNNGNEAELMTHCEQWIESQQPLITGQGP
ncbi:lysophospholipid acyltransferase family protein, partial [Neisseria sp. P0015.S004]